MCGISGFFNSYDNYLNHPEYYNRILEKMSTVQARRGPDDSGKYLSPHVGFSHARLSIIDLSSGHQPMLKTVGEHTYAIVYNGELYNTKELKDDLWKKGWTFQTTSDTEVILTGLIEYGPDFVRKMNGIFAFAVSDPVRRCLYLFRDRSGVKPLFYRWQEDTMVFASELKGILAYPGVTPMLDQKGLNEIFSVGPAKTYGCGVFKGIDEVLPGHFLTCTSSGITNCCYWKLESHPHEDDEKTTIEKTAFLVQDAIRNQMVSDVEICTLLSGGIDSSLVSAVCAGELRKQGKQLNTFSFDFAGNDVNFKANVFQPSQDRPYVEKMVDFLGSNHHYLECDNISQIDCLYDSVIAHDLPAMADIDSSMLHFCSKVKEHNKVTLTGECADEIFGGYPWFHKKECFDAFTFPWTMDLEARKVLLNDDFLEALQMDAYVKETYEKSLAETPRLLEDSKKEARRREISYLNQKWFMQTLLDRADRTSMYSGLEARVPFADHKIIEYVWNVPWDMKAKDGVVKHLLREAGRGLVPDEILFRKKSPYPKTYDLAYEKLLANRMQEIMNNTQSPVRQLLDRKKVERFLESPSDYGKPWFGQLMAGPQMLAYMIQVDFWLSTYEVKIEI